MAISRCCAVAQSVACLESGHVLIKMSVAYCCVCGKPAPQSVDIDVSGDILPQAGRWRRGELEKAMDPLDCAVAVNAAQKAAQAARRWALFSFQHARSQHACCLIMKPAYDAGLLLLHARWSNARCVQAETKDRGSQGCCNECGIAAPAVGRPCSALAERIWQSHASCGTAPSFYYGI